jgi:hypothetical protein
MYDVPLTISKASQTNSLSGGGRVRNSLFAGTVNSTEPNTFTANGFFGLNSISSEFGSQISYNRGGTNPQGQTTLYVRSCNNPDGSVDTACKPEKPETHHVYFIKSNAISELSLTAGGSASFGSKTNVTEQKPDGSKVGIDGGGTMQIIFTPVNKEMPSGMFVGTDKVCRNQSGCVAITVFRSTGGVWFSSAWGQPTGANAPKTYLKNVINGSGTLVIN